VRVPTIAWWPGRVPAGTSTDVMCGMFDILPTFAAIAGAKVPTDRKIDGADIRAVLLGETITQPPHEAFYYYRGLRLQAVRDLEWKLVLPPPAKPDEKARSPQLYNLKTDIGESTDVAAQHPEIVARLQKLVAGMEDDLGTDGPAPGSRPLGRVENAQPLIGQDGTVRPGFEAKTPAARKPE
jgi:arylsulfatase A-like enzyme